MLDFTCFVLTVCFVLWKYFCLNSSVTLMLFSDNDVLNVGCMLGRLCVFQGWCVKSSDPCTLNIHSVPKEVIPGQVNALGSFVSIMLRITVILHFLHACGVTVCMNVPKHDSKCMALWLNFCCVLHVLVVHLCRRWGWWGCEWRL